MASRRFCLQQTVNFKTGTSYAYTTTDSFAPNGPLTKGVAWLYDQFATGVLNGYNYTTASVRTTDSAELQSAIWYLQGETPYNGYTASTIGKRPLHRGRADSVYLALETRRPAIRRADINVAVMALTYGNTPAQDQLILIPPGQGSGSVPDGGSTVGFAWACASRGLPLCGENCR